MRHYEIVFLVHPDQSAEVPKMIKQCKSTIESTNGKVHRLEKWGLRQLAYPINKVRKAHYVLMNIECTSETRKELADTFHFSDAVLRNLILNREQPILEPSPIQKAIKDAEAHKKAAQLKKSEEQNLVVDADLSDLAAAKSEQNTTKNEDVKDQVTEAKITTITENIELSADTQEPKKDTVNIGENDGEDIPKIPEIPKKTEPTDTTKD